MDTRNWLSLSRQLVNRFDMNYSFTAVQNSLAQYASSWFGNGVISTTLYPNPFPITLSNMSLGGTVGNGIAFDINGQITRIDSSSSTSKTFSVVSDPFNPRFDLLCIQYVAAGDTPVPKPSDPLTTIFLNYHDDFQLVVVPGTPSGSPVYPAKGNPLYIVLAGIQIPAGATLGTQCTIDYFPRELAHSGQSAFPEVIQEIPAGTIDGVNAQFTLSQPAVSNESILVRVDGRTLAFGTDWSIIGQVITLARIPQFGQSVSVWYLVSSPMSQNPITGAQEVPVIAPNGVIDTFSLVGRPGNQESTIVFVDGLEVDLVGWNLIQGNTNAIQFNSGYIPTTGQSISVFYLTNPFIFGTQPAPAPSPGTGGLTAFGTAISPQTIAAGTGIPATMDQRQLWFTQSSGGPQTVTAIPQITPGTIVGQELLIEGTSATNYIILTNGNGLSLNGPIDLTDNSGITLIWNGSVWAENARR